MSAIAGRRIFPSIERASSSVATARVAAALVAALVTASPSQARRVDLSVTGLGPILGRPAPNFGFPGRGGPSNLAALRGRTVVLNFWATYCAPCIEELSAFAKLPGAFGQSVELIEISDESPDTVRPILHDHAVDAVVLDDFERTVFKRYGVTPIPTTLIVAPDGTISYVSVGQLDWPELEKAVREAAPAPLETVAQPAKS